MVDAGVDPADASQRAGLGQVYRVRVKEHGETVMVLEKAIVTMIPNYFRPKVFSEDSIGRPAGEAERPEHSVVVYKASQVLK
jgi:hypothetical protein